MGKPELKGIRIENGTHYAQNKAVVEIETHDRNFVVEYPIQGDRHLHMLMREVWEEDGQKVSADVPHNLKFEIKSAIEALQTR